MMVKLTVSFHCRPMLSEAERGSGLSFSVQPGVKIPPSLRNMYTEIKANYPDFNVPKHGFVESKARSIIESKVLLDTSGHGQNKAFYA